MAEGRWEEEGGNNKGGRQRSQKKETGKKRIREEEEEENETVIVKSGCVNLFSTEAFDIFSQGQDLESCGSSWVTCGMILVGVSDCVSGTGTSGVCGALLLTDVPVSPSSVVTEVL